LVRLHQPAGSRKRRHRVLNSHPVRPRSSPPQAAPAGAPRPQLPHPPPPGPPPPPLRTYADSDHPPPQVASADEVNKGEIVLCKVQPQHLILRAFGLGEGEVRRAPRAALYPWQGQRAPQGMVLERGYVWKVGGCLELIRLQQPAGFDQAATANQPLLVRTRHEVSGDFGEFGSDRCGKQNYT